MLRAVDVPSAGTTASAEDALLTAWARHGDRNALGELFSLCRPQAFALALRLCGRGAAEDAVQDGFFKVMRQARSWRGGSARGWLLATVANTARDALRSETRRIHREATAPKPPPMPDSPVEGDLSAVVHSALGELPVHERSALELHYFAGLDLDQTAAALGRPYKTVHSQMARGLERLRDILGRHGVTASVAVLSATLVGTTDAAEPPGLASTLEHLANHGPMPATPWTQPTLILTGVVALTILAWSLTPTIAPAPIGQAAAEVAPVDPLQALLDRPVRVRFLHDRLDEALAVLDRALPADSCFRYAIPEGVAAPWEGITWTPAGMPKVRQALDALTAQAGLVWTDRGGVVVVHPPTTADVEAKLPALLATRREPIFPGRTPAEIDDAGLKAVLGTTRSNMVTYELVDFVNDATAERINYICDAEAERILGASISLPDSLGRIVMVGLDPLKPGLGRQVLQLVNTSPGWFTEEKALSPASIAPHRVASIRLLTGDPAGTAAVRCLRAHAARTADLGGVRCQVLLAARVAAAARAPGAADAIAAVLEQDAGPSAWRIAMGGCLAELRDPRAVPILITALPDARPDTGEAMHALAIVGAVEELLKQQAFAALGWCPDGAGLPLIRRRIVDTTLPADSYQYSGEAIALLRAGVRSVPTELARALTPTEFSDAVATALVRCGGIAGVAPLLTWAEGNAKTMQAAGQALALVEDPQALPLLSRELTGPVSGRMVAAAVGLASGRLAGAATALQGAIASLTAHDHRTIPLWFAALGGRDDALATSALAEIRRRGPTGAAILGGLAMARTPAALNGGWALAADPTAVTSLRLAALRALPKTTLPARDQALTAILGQRSGPPEVRAATLVEAAAAGIPACVAAVRAAAVEDPSGWVRACAIFAGQGKVMDSAFLAARLTGDPSPQVRCYAAASLGQAESDADILVKALASEENSRVRETLVRLLAQSAFVAPEGKLADAAHAAAQRCLATESDPAARAALQALSAGIDPGPARIGPQNARRSWSYRLQFHDLRSGRSWSRQFWPPQQTADHEDPGLPFSDG